MNTLQITQQVVNQYFICLQQASLKPIPWNIYHTNCDPAIATLDPTCIYFNKVFQEMEQHLTVRGLTFYLTWDTDKLPSYGDNVVAILLGDEHCRIPSYIHKVRAIFKTLTTRLMMRENFFLQPSYLNLMILIQFLRSWLIRTPGLLNFWFHRLIGAKIAHIYDIPLGYYKQDDLPVKDIVERQYDIFFAGSLMPNHPILSWRYWLRNPKDIVRKQMLSAVKKLPTKYAQLKIAVSTTNDFGLEGKFYTDERSYSEKLMDTKICLAPRGTVLETFRFFEGLRYGCIVVAQVLPDSWFYQGCPAIQLSAWNELEQIIEGILQNKELMQIQQEKTLKFWHEKCSEVSVGNFMAAKLNSP
ncbi:glycosyltransferase family 1 protein [Anabaena sphaerica FACHB-251]|uniref:Glycosyltransferase family 1 protein n=1 Tax=Anabaena sphaerica FACHB-251 TaxID=2692883 RepID=A0A927A1R9_9NOST|nr:glycosyltransferase family 1 protein [Anabaena sphaerica]MBD2296497.1 glycosyltransferase family 1 protein [Anabaena sphaerica FACHB-251]